MSTGSNSTLEDRSGALYWPALQDIARQTYLNADTVQLLKERLKSDATHIVLNTLTALHTISVNASRQVRDQIVLSKCMKHLERLLNRPPFPGVEMAAAQLLIDWAFLFGAEDLGNKSFHLLTNTNKHRAMVQGMQPSDVAVMLREDQRLGMPRFVSVLKGLDFGRQFAMQFASPLTGAVEPPSVLSKLAAAAVAASYSGSSTAAAAAAAASRNTFAAWAERVQGDPQAAAQQVLSSKQQVEADIAALSAAEAAVLAAAGPFLKQASTGSSSSSSSTVAAAAAAADYTQLRHELDRAYLVACKVTEWREMIQVLVQQQLPDTQLSSLLSLADLVNGTLEKWSAAATTELFWLLGVNTAGLADGSLLRKIVAKATGGVAGTGNSSSSSTPLSAAGQTGSRQQQQQQLRLQGTAREGAGNFTTRSSYLDLLTGDALPATGSTNNPFLTNVTGISSTHPASSAGQLAAAAAGRSNSIPPEVQSYIQETAARPAGVASSPAPATALAPPATAPPVPAPPAAATAAAAAGHSVLAPVASSAAPAATAAAAPTASGPTVQAAKLYPVVPQPLLQQPQQYISPPPQQQQQQQRSLLQPEQSTAQHGSGTAGLLCPAVAGSTADRAGNAGGSSKPINTKQHTVTNYSSGLGCSSSPAGAVAAGAGAGRGVTCSSSSAAAAAAGDTGSSADSAVAGGFSYINPFASLDTSTIMSSIKSSGQRSSVDGATAAAAVTSGSTGVGRIFKSIDGGVAAAAAAAGVAVSLKACSSSADSEAVEGSTGSAAAAPAQPQRQWQQQQSDLLRKPPPVPKAAAATGLPTAAAAAGATGPHIAVAAAGAAGPHTIAAVHQECAVHAVDSQQQQQLQPSSSSSTVSYDTVAGAAPAAVEHQQQQHTTVLQPHQIGLLQQKLQHAICICNSSSSCHACSMPDAKVLNTSLLQLLIQQQQEFEGRLQYLQQQHCKEVADLKATAIRRFKELQQELEQAKKQQQQEQHCWQQA